MKKKRTWHVALSAFSLTMCLLLGIGGFLLVSIRSGRTLFGEQYEPVALQQELPVDDTGTMGFAWLPARLRAVLRVPMWEVQLFEWVLKFVE